MRQKSRVEERLVRGHASKLEAFAFRSRVGMRRNKWKPRSPLDVVGNAFWKAARARAEAAKCIGEADIGVFIEGLGVHL